MTRFVAIPVRIGDAFYLERGGRSVLVDGGKSQSAFPELFRLHVNRDQADIVVCTHNDADHANGIIGFLDAGFACREIWLPGRWLDVLKDVLPPDEVVVDDVIGGAIKYWSDAVEGNQRPPESLEEVGTLLSEPAPPRLEAQLWQGNDPADWPEDVAEAFEPAEALVEPEDSELWWRQYIPVTGRPIAEPAGFWQVVREAIEAAKRIREIARLAFDNGVPVRWFEHAPHGPSGGIPGFLHPVGARQVVRVFPYRPLFERLALTTVNKESLVLYSPRDTQSPGVLFCAHSDLRSMILSIQPRDLITVPHHGAEANRDAYTSILLTPA